MLRWSCVLVFCAVLVIACEAPTGVVVGDQPLPPGVDAYGPNPPPVGGIFSFRVEGGRSGFGRTEQRRVFDRVLPDRSPVGNDPPVPAYRIQSSDGVMSVYGLADQNLLALMTEGVAQEVHVPARGRFSWPLWVGKEWVSIATVRRGGEEIEDVTEQWRVAGTETLRTRAGTFETLRIVGNCILNCTGSETFWYAPRLGIAIRLERFDAAGAWAASESRELIRYQLP